MTPTVVYDRMILVQAAANPVGRGRPSTTTTPRSGVAHEG